MWPYVIILLFVGLLAVDPALLAKFEKAVEGISGSLVGGAAGSATKWWIIGSVAATGLGIVTWLVIDSIAEKRGQEVAPPALGAIGATTGPPVVTAGTRLGTANVYSESGVSGGSSTAVPTQVQHRPPKQAPALGSNGA